MRRTRNVWIAAVVAAVILLGSSMAMAGTFDDWDYRMKITFSGNDPPGGGELLTNFPALVVLNTNIDNFSYTNFESGTGADLRFADSNETTELNYEIEEWDTNGSSYIWVQVPELADTNDFIYAYWGGDTNAPVYITNGATWFEGYVAVWHLGESDAMAQDSTSNNNAAVSVSGLPAGTNGIIADANDFVAAESDYIKVNASSDFDMSGTFTVNAWVYSRANAGGEGILGCYKPGWILALNDTTPTNELNFYSGSAWLYSETAVSEDTWSHVAFVYNSADDPNDGKFYINGVNVATVDMANRTGNDNLTIGAGGQDWTANRFDGVIDEVRVSSVARSSNWVWACWMNQGSNDVFIGYDTATLAPTNLKVNALPVSGIGSTNAALRGQLGHIGDAENPDIYFCWDYSDQGTTSTGNWGNVDYMGTNWGKWDNFSTNITGLISGSNYSYRCYVTNSTGEDWSDDVRSFTTIYLSVVTNTGATNVFRQAATLRGEITDTGEDTPQVWFYYWIDGNSTTSTVAVGLQAGVFSEEVNGLTMATNYTYEILASNMAGTVWSGQKSFETLPFGAGTNIWTGGGVADNWSDHENWIVGVPLAGEHVIITNVATEVLLSSSTPDLASFTITNATVTFTNWTTTISATNVTVQSGGLVTLPGSFIDTVMSNRVYFICSNLTLEVGGTINADAAGHAGGAPPAPQKGYGPGGGLSGLDGRGGGGGYGGKGGAGNYAYGGDPYGLTNAPTQPGSGGGSGNTLPSLNGGAGGGAIRIDASGTVAVYDLISADGGNGFSAHAGGGSGGGIYITCSKFDGSTNGLLRADGGRGYNTGASGGGGRIAVIYDQAVQAVTPNPGVRFSTVPGTYKPGENGTVYLPDTRFLSETLIDDLFMNVRLFGITNWNIGSLTVSNCDVTFAEDGFQLTVTNALYIGAGGSLGLDSANSTLECGSITLTNAGTMSVYSGMTNAATTNYGALVSVTGDIFVGSNSWIYAYSHETNGGSILFRMNNLTVVAGGGFDADGRGYAAGYKPVQWIGYGPGGGNSISDGRGAGGGHGGQGANNTGGAVGGSTYGSTNAPVGPGSGGGTGNAGLYVAGRGGGVLRIEAAGTATIDGTLTADGQNGVGSHSGGGAGGSIFLTSSRFSGNSNGVLRADGGNGQNTGGGGGGGRIAVWYAVPESERARILAGDMQRVSITNEYSEFPGTLSVTNGTSGAGNGEPGTIVFLTVTPPAGTMFMCQ